MTEKVVYVVLPGNYYEPNDINVYDDLELAKIAQGRMWSSIEEHVVNPYANELRAGFCSWRVMNRKDSLKVSLSFHLPDDEFIRFEEDGMVRGQVNARDKDEAMIRFDELRKESGA